MSDNKGQTYSQENTDSIQPCSCGGNCDSSESCSQGRCWKMVIFILIVIAAGIVLARSFIRKSNSNTNQSQQAFVSVQTDIKSDTPSPLKPVVKADALIKSKNNIETPSVVDETTKQDISIKAAPPLWGPELDSLASLNKVAADTDAVFVLLLATENQESNQNITREIEAATKTIKADGIRMSVFKLNKAAPDYAQLAKQLSVPSVVAMVKGRGMSTVSGEISEAKLVQAFVTASRPASGCCPSGAGSPGCAPSGPRR